MRSVLCGCLYVVDPHPSFLFCLPRFQVFGNDFSVIEQSHEFKETILNVDTNHMERWCEQGGTNVLEVQFGQNFTNANANLT